MKKIFIFLILFTLPLKVFATSSYIVMDSDSKRVLEGNNQNEKMLIASTTKIMTAIIAIENANIQKTIKVNDKILKAYGSNIYIEINEKIKLIDLIYGLMLRSGNDASLAIANGVAKDEKSFVKLMNKKAKKIGMDNTFFYNPHGLEEQNGLGNTSTAYDMALLMQYAMKNKTFQKIVSTKYYSLKTNFKSYTWKNKNRLLFDYKYTTGGKTGFTKKARRTLVTSAKKDNKKLIIVTLNYADDFNFHKNLYEKNFNNTIVKKILDKDKFNVKSKYAKNYKLYIKKDYKILIKQNDKIKTNIKINKNKNPKENSVIGLISIYLNDVKIDNVEIFAKHK